MRVLVTGANGHLGYNLVSALLGAGHRVRASVRSLADREKTQRLRQLGAVELVEVALERPDQMRAAMQDVELLFHAAAIYAYYAPGRSEEIVAASVQGAESAMRAAAAAGVRKVILTSSLVTLPLTPPGDPPVDESQWTTDLSVPYVRAKVEAERIAWLLAGESGLDLVTILPGAIAGPGFIHNTPSIDLIEVMMRGGFRVGVPDFNFPLVDVRDVVAAHLLAADKRCDGRFVVCNDVLPSFRAMLQTMHEIDPAIRLPLMTMPAFMSGAMPWFDWLNHRMLGTPRSATPELMSMFRGRIWNASNGRVKKVLGWRQQVSPSQCLRDTIEVLRARQAVAA
jgi:dihydroflavonol-4-reductase